MNDVNTVQVLDDAEEFDGEEEDDVVVHTLVFEAVRVDEVEQSSARATLGDQTTGVIEEPAAFDLHDGRPLQEEVNEFDGECKMMRNDDVSTYDVDVRLELRKS